jgi:hypothetical protein
MLEYFAAAKTLIDSIVEIREKLLPGISSRSRNFVEVVDPLFQQLHPVVDDYFILFRKASYLLHRANTIEQLYDASFELAQAREKLIVTRIAVRTETDLLAAMCHDRDTGRFLKCVASIFEAQEVSTNTNHKISKSNHIVSLVQQLSEDATNRANLIYTLEGTIRHLESRWEATVRSYYILRMKHLMKRGVFVYNEKLDC